LLQTNEVALKWSGGVEAASKGPISHGGHGEYGKASVDSDPAAVVLVAARRVVALGMQVGS
jgi:hypothetical protein